MTTTVRLRVGRAGTARLVIDHDGSRPPSDLLFKLRRDGWRVSEPSGHRNGNEARAPFDHAAELGRSSGRVGWGRLEAVSPPLRCCETVAARRRRWLERELATTLAACGFDRFGRATWVRGSRARLRIEIDPSEITTLIELLRAHHRSAVISLAIIDRGTRAGSSAVVEIVVVEEAVDELVTAIESLGSDRTPSPAGGR